MFDGLTEYSAYVFTVLNSKRIYSSTVDGFSKFGYSLYQYGQRWQKL